MDDGIWLVSTSPPYEKTHLFTTSLPAQLPVFSPDGKYILFAQGERSAPSNPIYLDLYLIDSNGSFIGQLTYDSAIDYAFDWSPDGQYTAFGSKRSSPTYIWRARIVIALAPPVDVVWVPTKSLT